MSRATAAAVAAAVLTIAEGGLPEKGAAADEFLLELWTRYRVDYETVYEAEDPDDEIDQAKPRFTGVGVLSYGNWSLNAVVDIRTVGSGDPGENRYFEDIGFYAEELFLAYGGDDWQVYGGKFNPRFGQAFGTAPGLYGDDFAKDYEIEEQLGVGGVLTISEGSDLLGTAELSANLFMADRTVLSNSAFERRGRLFLDDGGPANTQRPESFSLTLDGWDPGYLPGLTYNAGVMLRAAGEGDAEDELGAVLGLEQRIALSETLELTVMGEVARFVSFEAGGDDATYLTVGAELDVEGWRVGVGGAAIVHDRHAAPDRTDTLFTLDLRKDWKLGPGRLRTQVGWALIDEKAIESHALGVRIDYRIPFTIIF